MQHDKGYRSTNQIFFRKNILWWHENILHPTHSLYDIEKMLLLMLQDKFSFDKVSLDLKKLYFCLSMYGMTFFNVIKVYLFYDVWNEYTSHVIGNFVFISDWLSNDTFVFLCALDVFSNFLSIVHNQKTTILYSSKWIYPFALKKFKILIKHSLNDLTRWFYNLLLMYHTYFV